MRSCGPAVALRLRAGVAIAAALLAFGAPALLAPAAQANAGDQVLIDCVDNNPTVDALAHRYTLPVLQQALADLSNNADVSEYTDCSQLIKRAEVAALSGAHVASTHSSPHSSSHATAPVTRSGGGGGGGGGGGPQKSSQSSQGAPSPTQSAATGPLTPTQQSAVNAAAANGGAVRVGDHSVQPGLVHVSVASAVSALPAPLLIVFLLILAAGLFAGGRLLRPAGGRLLRRGRVDSRGES